MLWEKMLPWNDLIVTPLNRGAVSTNQRYTWWYSTVDCWLKEDLNVYPPLHRLHFPLWERCAVTREHSTFESILLKQFYTVLRGTWVLRKNNGVSVARSLSKNKSHEMKNLHTTFVGTSALWKWNTSSVARFLHTGLKEQLLRLEWKIFTQPL